MTGDADSDDGDLESLILQVLSGDRRGAALLFEAAERYAMRVITVRAPDLPEDLRDDAFQEALELLLRTKPGHYDPTRGSAKQFFRLLVINAIRRVRVGFTPPGQVTRSRKKPRAAGDTDQVEVVKLVAVPCLDDLPPLEDEDSMVPFAAVEARIDAPRLLAAAPPLVERALRLIHFDDVPVQEAAARLDLSRFALRRQIIAFAPSWRHAA